MGDLTEPLLPPPSGRDPSSIVPHHHGPITALASAVACVARVFTRWLAPLLPRSWRPLHLPPDARAALAAAREAAVVPFDDSVHGHDELFPALWRACFDDDENAPPPPLPAARPSPRWTDAGWQGPDPATDLRGAGAAALAHLLHLSRAKEHAPLFTRLRHKRRPYVASDEYPFAAAGVNVSYMLASVACLHDPRGGASPVAASGAPRSAPARGYAALLAAAVTDDAALAAAAAAHAPHAGLPAPYRSTAEAHGHRAAVAALAVAGDVYACVFETLDDVWCARRASYMAFGGVSADVEAALRGTLAERPASVGELRARLRARLDVE